ncbi:MAG: thiamine-phosphate synthase family protein [Candidatus Bathyarchaeia archaeon]
MKAPCELVVKEFIPNLRVLIAKELMLKYGWSQEKIAKRLGVTQPAVSGYLAIKETDMLEELKNSGISEFAKRISEGLANGRMNVSEALEEICRFCISLKIGGIVCILHKKAIPVLSEEDCKACSNLYSKEVKLTQEKYNVLIDLEKATSLIKNSEKFAKLIPEVQVNIASAIDGAKTIFDVAGIPGRIVKVRGKAQCFMKPEFGVSHHMAMILLSMKEIDKNVRSAMNIKYDRSVKEAIEKAGLKTVFLERIKKPIELTNFEDFRIVQMKKAVQEIGYVPDVIVDEGGYGIEPCAYLFDRSAINVVKKALNIVDYIK